MDAFGGADCGQVFATMLSAYTNNGISVVLSDRLKPAVFSGNVKLTDNSYIRADRVEAATRNSFELIRSTGGTI